MPVRRDVREEGAWIRPYIAEPGGKYLVHNTPYADIVAAHGVTWPLDPYERTGLVYVSLGDRETDAPITRQELALMERKIDALRGELLRHEAEARQRADFLVNLAGLPDVTPAQVDQLADAAYAMLTRGEITDPIAFAERTKIDIRVAGVVFRRLLQQDRIEEA